MRLSRFGFKHIYRFPKIPSVVVGYQVRSDHDTSEFDVVSVPISLARITFQQRNEIVPASAAQRFYREMRAAG